MPHGASEQAILDKYWNEVSSFNHSGDKWRMKTAPRAQNQRIY
jgi:hypothetical protein